MNTQIPLSSSRDQSKTGYQVIRWFVRESMGVVMMAVILCLASGRVDWLMGWMLVLITALWIIGTALVVIPRNPELLAERVGPKTGTKRWDVAILAILGVITIVQEVVAGLDMRYGWSTGITIPAQIAGLVIAAAGYALVIWATGTNAFFAQTVRVQTERGHRVVTGGPYRLVRHPAYTGMILFELASAIMLGSWWVLLLSGIASILIIVRTALEDKVLHRELSGYLDYAQHTRSRLLPGIW